MGHFSLSRPHPSKNYSHSRLWNTIKTVADHPRGSKSKSKPHLLAPLNRATLAELLDLSLLTELWIAANLKAGNLPRRLQQTTLPPTEPTTNSDRQNKLQLNPDARGCVPAAAATLRAFLSATLALLSPFCWHRPCECRRQSICLAALESAIGACLWQWPSISSRST